MKYYVSVLFFLIFLGSNVLAQNDTLTDSEDAYDDVPMITITASELESDQPSQDLSGLLQASRDIFVSRAAYIFSNARFRMRGYDSKNTRVLINNLPMNNIESGRAYWSNWGGLNDAVRNKVIVNGLNPTDYGFGGVGGLTNISTLASKYRPQTKLSISAANKSYRNRVMLTHSSGMSDKGWAYTISGSRRWAEEGIVEGSFYDAWSYFLSLEKKINTKHTVLLTGFGSSNRRGKSGVGTQEVYDLTDNNYYNPYWGYQQGEKRNARVSNYHKPKIILNHFWDINEDQKLTSGVQYTFGRGGSTALNWYDAADPRPDYYKYLPSYWEDDANWYNFYTEQWQNNENFRQLNWDDYYQANRQNLYTVTNVDGELGNDVTGNRAKYIVEDRRTDIQEFGYNSTYKNKLGEHLNIVAAVNAILYKGRHFKMIDDLLGADWWLDIDQFAERDFADEDLAQSDLDNPNRLVSEGDIFGYDYFAHINEYDAFGQAELKYNRIDLYAALKLGYTEFWREGNMRNGKFPLNSLGESTHYQFFNYAGKGGVNLKIDGRNFFLINAAYINRAPYFREVYISPRTRNDVVDNITSEYLYSGDVNFIHRSDLLETRITGYYTSFKDQIETSSFYHDELNTFVNYIMTDMDQLNYGAELGLKLNITSSLSFNGTMGYGKYLYSNRPNVTISRDNDSEILADNRTCYLENYHIGNIPELVSSVGINYSSSNYWFAGVNLAYFDNVYMDVNPDRRTVDALEHYVVSDPQWGEMLEQEQLDPGYTLNFFGGKSWKLDDYFIGLTLSVNNILNEQDYRTGGFEQYRYEISDLDKFPSKYFYMYGRTYYLNLYFSF